MKFSIYTFVFYMMYFKFSGTYKITKRTESGCRSVVSDSVTPRTVVHGILQATILKCVVVSFSRGSSQPRDLIQVSHIAGRFFTV